MTRLYSLRILVWMALSNLLPPVFRSLLSTIPPKLMMLISVVSAPILTIIVPLELRISKPTPRPSASAFSIRYTRLARRLELSTRSKKALFSTSVISVGTAI